MKKLLYILGLPLMFCAGKAGAQSFTMETDTMKTAVYGYADIHNNITNNTSDTIRVSWYIFQSTLPQSWKDYAQFGLCDNVSCYDRTILGGSVQVTDPMDAGKPSLFKVQIDGSSSQVTPGGPYYVSAELTSGTTIDTAVFVFNKWATGVTTAKMLSKDDVTLYPNPAQNEVNVIFSKDLNVRSASIYNLLGKQVTSYRVAGENAKLSIDNIPSGIYFVRLMDNTGRVVATRRFTHQ